MLLVVVEGRASVDFSFLGFPHAHFFSASTFLFHQSPLRRRRTRTREGCLFAPLLLLFFFFFLWVVAFSFSFSLLLLLLPPLFYTLTGYVSYSNSSTGYPSGFCH
ncbi:hypothetical protein Dimus_034908 [Dionaea muscipula]